jgi:hypothetical protein
MITSRRSAGVTEEESSFLRITLDRIILGMKSLFLASETRDVLSVLASTEEKDAIDNHQEVNTQEVNTGNESSFVMERLKCKKDELPVREKDVEIE